MDKTNEWVRSPEYYHSPYGYVIDAGDGWIGKVKVNGKVYRLDDMFSSADGAKAAVERTYKREVEKWQKRENKQGNV